MKKTWKRISALLLLVLLLAAMPATAFAADSVVSFNGKLLGLGFQPGSGYTLTDLFDNFKNVMPGDVLEENITVQNNATDCSYIKVYLKAVVHDEAGNPLTYNEAFENADGKDQAEVAGVRDETVASMQNFLRQLNMKIYNGSTLIYDSTPDQAGALVNSVLLGQLNRGASLQLRVVLSVPIDMGNEYANRVGEVDWVFTAEAFNNDSYLIQTGQLYWPIPVFGGLGLLLIVGGLLMMRKKRREDRA